MKSIYVLQPYHVDSRNAKSLAVVIPAEVAKEYNADTSTVFVLHVDGNTKKITLQTIDGIIEKHRKNIDTFMTSTDESLNISNEKEIVIGSQYAVVTINI